MKFFEKHVNEFVIVLSGVTVGIVIGIAIGVAMVRQKGDPLNQHFTDLKVVKEEPFSKKDFGYEFYWVKGSKYRLRLWDTRKDEFDLDVTFDMAVHPIDVGPGSNSIGVVHDLSVDFTGGLPYPPKTQGEKK